MQERNNKTNNAGRVGGGMGTNSNAAGGAD